MFKNILSFHGILSRWLIVCLFFYLAGLAKAASLAWEFAEQEGTSLTAVSGINQFAKWSDDLGESSTSGHGGLLLRNPKNDGVISHCKLDKAKPGERVWLVTSITRWSFTKGTPCRVGIGMASSVGRNHRVLAEIILEGSAKRGLRIMGNAVPSSEGAVGTKALTVRNSKGADPLMLALEYIPENNAYNVYYLNEKKLTLLGRGKTSPVRSPKYVFINLKSKLEGNTQEFIEIGALAVSYRR